jgi:ferredoxin
MAKIIHTKTGQEIEIVNGSSIKEACEKFGIPFGCCNGFCGTCRINIDYGEENLSKLTDEEEMLERDKKHRLACQCKINKGEAGISR